MRLFLFAIGARDRASSRLRIWDHVDWLRAAGHTVVADSLTPPARELTRARLARRILTRLPKWIAAFFRADAVVIQETLLLWPLIALRRLGKRRTVVFDFSDPVDRIHGRGGLRALAFRRMIEGADSVMVENRRYQANLTGTRRPVLHQYGPVDTARYREGRALVDAGPEMGHRLRIGWTGSPGTYRFIAPLVPIIDRIAANTPLELCLIGMERIPETLEHAKLTLLEWDETDEFHQVPTFDLALFRLEPTEDAQWRGAGKLFIYMAAGVPFVATDSGIAHDVMEESHVGFPVATDGEWESVLRQAIADREERHRMSHLSLQHADRELSYDRYRERLTALLQASGERA